MSKQPEKTARGDKEPFSTNLPEGVRDELNEFVRQAGVLQWRAVQAAILALTLAPHDLQGILLRADREKIKQWFDDAQQAKAYRFTMRKAAEARRRPEQAHPNDTDSSEATTREP